MFSGARERGSFMNGVPVQVSDVENLRSALIMTGFPYGFREKLHLAMSQFESFLVESQAVRRGGSAALDMCYAAHGRVDGFWEMDLHPWDTAAGLVILEEAGGRVTDFSGGEFSVYGKQLVASNGKVHDEIAASASTNMRTVTPILTTTIVGRRWAGRAR
jgi:myo-inositol-1(or 4)-monophosphatase